MILNSKTPGEKAGAGFSQYPPRSKENRSSGDSVYSPDDLATTFKLAASADIEEAPVRLFDSGY